MSNQLVGDMLRERREALGLSIDQMARTTNIRPRLLETFESSDYDKFPPKGYASGMLSSYARALGMDPRPVLSGFEMELSHHQQQLEIAEGARNAKIGRDSRGFSKGSTPSARRNRRDQDSSSPRTTGPMDPLPGSVDTAGDIARATSAIKVVSKSSRRSAGGRSAASASAAGGSRLDAYKRTMSQRYSDAPEQDLVSSMHSSSAATTGRISALAASTGSFAAVDDVFDEDEELLEDDYELRGGGRRQPRSRTGSSRTRRYSAPAQESLPARIAGTVKAAFSDKRTRLIILAAALIIAALVIVASLLMSTAGGNSSGILNVTGGASGESSTQTGEDKETGAAVVTVTTANGNPVVVSVDVEQGKTSLVTVTYDDDKAFDGTAVGPWHRDFQVTQSFSASFGTPSAVTVTQNGTPIEIPTTEDGSGKLEISVQASGLAANKN
ncbi:MAG: helix-turn-helix domain-containing protein [Coriobacteriales bacterium]